MKTCVACFTLLVLGLLPLPAQAILCRDLFAADGSNQVNEYFEESVLPKEVEDLILSGPFKEVAIDILDLSFDIASPQVVKLLARSFASQPFDRNPAQSASSDWYRWKANLQLQRPLITEVSMDWTLLWNIHGALNARFKDRWSDAQMTWMSLWLVNLVKQSHFGSNFADDSGRPGALRVLQDPVLRELTSDLLVDLTFKQSIAAAAEASRKFDPLFRHRFARDYTLSESLESQKIVNLIVQLLYSRLLQALDDFDFRQESPPLPFVPANYGRHLEDLFTSPDRLQLAVDLMNKIFAGRAIPLSEDWLRASLRLAIHEQLEPILLEALHRKPGNVQGSETTSKTLVDLPDLGPPLDLAASVVNIKPGQAYRFRMARHPELPEQSLIFEASALEIFAIDPATSLNTFIKSIQYGFTDLHGPKGLKKISRTHYELKPGYSAYRMVLRREGLIWTAIATLHKDRMRNLIEDLK